MVVSEPAARGEEPAAQAAGNAHGQLAEILQRPLYQRWKLRQERASWEWEEVDFENDLFDSIVGMIKDALQSIVKLVEDVVDSFIAWLKRWFSIRPPPGPRSSSWVEGLGGVAGLLRLLGWIALAALLVFLVWLGFRLLRDIEPRGSAAHVLSREQVQAALESGEALALAGPQWLVEADRLAGARDFRSVYRALYLALLSGLHTAGKIDFRKSRTNWTYVSRFRGPGEQRDLFSSLTALFDDVWYGLKEAEGASIEMVKRQVSSLMVDEGAHG
jgi:hypothetical protein